MSPGTRSEVEKLVEQGQLKEAWSALEGKGDVHDANFLVKALCAEGDAASARRLVLNLRNYNIQPTSKTYEYVLSLLVKLKKLDEARSFLADMHRQQDKVSADALHNLLWAFVSEDRHAAAGELLAAHQRFTADAGDKLVSTMLSGFVAAGKAADARSLLFRMKTELGVSPTDQHLALAVRATMMTREGWAAYELLTVAHGEFGIPVIEPAVVDVFACLSRQKEWLAVEILLEDLENATGLKPTWNLYLPLVESLADNLFVFEVIRLLQKMETVHGVTPNVAWINEQLDKICQKARLDLAEEVVRNVSAKWNVKTFSGMIREASTIYDIDKVKEYFTIMDTFKINPDIFAWNCLLRCEYNLNGSRGRERVRRQIERSGVKFDTYTTKVLKFTEAKRPTSKLLRRKRNYETLVNDAIAAGKKQRRD